MTPWVRVTLAEVRGSAPREAGAAMDVTADGQTGTIGGGALEWEATGIARRMLVDGSSSLRRTFPLGPALGQCCGGSVVVSFEAGGKGPSAVGLPVWIWGAGHVGRALAAVLAPLPHLALTWADTSRDRFPDEIPGRVDALVASDLPRAMPHAPGNAHHLILTYSHEIDLHLCDAALRHIFASVGLIGSATKWARFQSRLRALGHNEARISQITCPIGDPGLGKHPQAIAIGVASGFLCGQDKTEIGRAS